MREEKDYQEILPYPVDIQFEEREDGFYFGGSMYHYYDKKIKIKSYEDMISEIMKIDLDKMKVFEKSYFCSTCNDGDIEFTIYKDGRHAWMGKYDKEDSGSHYYEISKEEFTQDRSIFIKLLELRKMTKFVKCKPYYLGEGTTGDIFGKIGYYQEYEEISFDELRSTLREILLSLSRKFYQSDSGQKIYVMSDESYVEIDFSQLNVRRRPKDEFDDYDWEFIKEITSKEYEDAVERFLYRI